MCLGIPMKILEIKDDLATAEVGGAKRKIGLTLVSDVKIGDYVIVHAGYAIQKLDKKQAEETLELMRQWGETLARHRRLR